MSILWSRIGASRHLNAASASMSPCSGNLDTQGDCWDKIGTFWRVDCIGSGHAVSPKLGLGGPGTGIDCF